MSELLQFLYKIQPTREDMLAEGHTPEEAQITSEHFEYLRRLTAEGVVILAGRTLNTDSSSFGIVILQTSSEDEARSIMNNDPGVRKGLMKAELYPYRIALMVNAIEE